MSRKYNQRTVSIYFAFIILLLLISARIFYLQVFRSNFFQSLAQDQRYRLMNLQGKRGDILDCQRRILAKSISCYSVFVDPALVNDPELVAKVLSAKLSVSKDNLLDNLKKKKRVIWVKRKISWEDKEKIKSLELEG
ncbi:MAG: hypothetical protein HQ570_01590, partial [Candidatus Omnitrophica bacterium]|nr:hypothetical protein [Candidatus Omnitrophota bacterium]